MKITKDFWIVFTKDKLTRFCKTKPALNHDELTTKVTFTYDTDLFLKPQFHASVNLNPNENLNIDITQLEHQINELKSKK